jgi:hypothetical protein
MARIGKIARLPREIRTELNRRLSDGERGSRLIEWLNSLPEVRSILQCDFENRDITKQNLYEWHQGGYPEWLAQQEALARAAEIAANATELANAVPGRMSDHLATLLISRYATELEAWDGNDPDEFRRKLRALSLLCQDVSALRRSDHDAARLELERIRMERDRDKTEQDVAAYFIRWIEYPLILDCIRDPDATPESRRDRLREILGIPDKLKIPEPSPS